MRGVEKRNDEVPDKIIDQRVRGPNVMSLDGLERELNECQGSH
jgi:hypothetical protein